MHTLQGKWPANVLFHLPKFPKSNMPHVHGLLLEGERPPPIPSVVLIKRTIMLLEMVVCLLVVPCYPHQSWSNTIYSCVCDVFTSTHSHVCVQRSEVDKPAFLITFHMIFLKLSHWTRSWPSQMNWLTGVPPGSSCPSIPSVRLKAHNAMPICSKT